MSVTDIDPTTIVNSVRACCRKVGATIPPALDRELAKLDEIRDRAADLGADFTDLPTRLVELVAAGEDVMADDAIRDHAIRKAILALNPVIRIDEELERRRAAVVAKHAPAIIESLRPAVEAADDALTTFRQARLNVELSDPRSTAPAGKTAVLGAARDAVAHLQHVDNAWAMLVNHCRLARIDPHTRPLILADLDGDQLDRLAGRKAEAVAYAGHRLSLATVEDYTARAERVAAQQAATQQARHHAEAQRAADASPSTVNAERLAAIQ